MRRGGVNPSRAHGGRDLRAGVSGGTNAIIWPAYFGIGALGEIKGAVNGVRNGGTALGPALVAALITAEGSAAPATLAVAVLLLAAGVTSFFMRAPAASGVRDPAM